MDSENKADTSRDWNVVWAILAIWFCVYACEEKLTPEEKEIEVDTYILR